MHIHYLNTDLDLVTVEEPTPLVAALASRGVYDLGVHPGSDGRWYITFETNRSYRTPDPNIGAMLGAIESLGERELRIWQSAELRVFDVGYDCGDTPHRFEQALENGTLRRIAATGACLRITIYSRSVEDEQLELDGEKVY